ncbi:MAG: fasciclin domain-containing protein [Alphaproteobacteria bacterium]|nr:fasciclin domain-containing protein [Alphaproteobacteria bacterium]
MKYLLATVSVLSLLGGMAAPACANNRSVEMALESDGGDLSMFYQALISTGVASELNENTEYTVFAPTNAAFSEIQPRIYPCFYAAQCRAEVAAVLRNHIVPRYESLVDLSRWGGPIATIGTRGVRVEEAYKDVYTADGHRILSRNEADQVALYPIDGVIANDRELAAFRAQPVAEAPAGTVIEKTVTTRTLVAPPVVSSGYLVPGGYPAAPVIYVAPDDGMTLNEMPDQSMQTTTVTHTTTTK